MPYLIVYQFFPEQKRYIHIREMNHPRAWGCYAVCSLEYGQYVFTAEEANHILSENHWTDHPTIKLEFFSDSSDSIEILTHKERKICLT